MGRDWGHCTLERTAAGGGGCARWGIAAPLSAVAAGSRSRGARVGEEGEGGGLSTLRTIAPAWRPPTPVPRALAAQICSVTALGGGEKGVEGLKGPSLEAGILRGRLKGGAFILAQPPLAKNTASYEK